MKATLCTSSLLISVEQLRSTTHRFGLIPSAMMHHENIQPPPGVDTRAPNRQMLLCSGEDLARFSAHHP